MDAQVEIPVMVGGGMLAVLALALGAPRAQAPAPVDELPSDRAAFVRACSDRLPCAKLEDTGHASPHHPARGHTPSTSSVARGAVRQNLPGLAARSSSPLLCDRHAVPSPLHLRL